MLISEDKLCHLFLFAHSVVIVAAAFPLLHDGTGYSRDSNFLLQFFFVLRFWLFFQHCRIGTTIPNRHPPKRTKHGWITYLFFFIYYLYKNKNVRSTIKFNCKWFSVYRTLQYTPLHPRECVECACVKVYESVSCSRMCVCLPAAATSAAINSIEKRMYFLSHFIFFVFAIPR